MGLLTSPLVLAASLAALGEIYIYGLYRETIFTTRCLPVIAGVAAIYMFLWGAWALLIYPFFVSPLRHLPRPKGEWPFIGQGFLPHRKPIGEVYLQWMREVPNEGLITYRSMFHRDRVLVTSPKAISEILVRDTYSYEKPAEERAVISRFLGNGLTIVEGNVHKFQRKHMNAVFTLSNIKKHYSTFWCKAQELAERIIAEISTSHSIAQHPANTCEFDTKHSTVQDVSHWASKTTLDIIGMAGLGKDFGNLKDVRNELFDVYQEVFEHSPTKDLFMAINRTLPTYFVQSLPCNINRRITATTKLLRSICVDLVDENVRNSITCGGGAPEKDIISQLMKSSGWGSSDLVEQLLTLVAAGHETSASSFTWACYLLAENPKVQHKLHMELFSALSDLKSAPTAHQIASTLENLPYLNAVCNETLRLFPPLPILRRTAKTDTVIANNCIPAGTHIILCPWATNRNPELWGTRAHMFWPERWISLETGRASNHGGANSNYANLTFSHGPRSCIGHRFAKAEMRSLVAVWCERFFFERATAEEVVPVGIVSTKPKDGLNLRIWEWEQISRNQL